MLKRREFLQHSAVLAALTPSGVLADVARPQTAGNRKPGPAEFVQFVIFDEAFEDSVTFAEELRARGAQSFAVQDDVSRLWRGSLGSAFTAGMSIAGLTAHSDLVVCADFARQRGARIRFEGSHDCRSSNVLTHSLRSSRDLADLTLRLAAADQGWPRALAASLNDPSLRMGETNRESRCQTSTKRSATHPGSLFSWQIV